MNWETVVPIVIGFLGLFMQAYFKDRADARRATLLAAGVKDVADVAERKANEMAVVAQKTKETIVEKIAENTEVSEKAFHEANQAKTAIAKVAEQSAKSIAQVAVRSEDKSADRSQDVLQELGNLKGELGTLKGMIEEIALSNKPPEAPRT